MGPCSRLSSVIASVQVNGPMQLLIASLLTVPSLIAVGSSLWGYTTYRQGPSTSYPIGYGLDFSVGILREFKVDCRSPEVVTANQRACEVRYEAKVESQGSVITRWLGKNKLS